MRAPFFFNAINCLTPNLLPFVQTRYTRLASLKVLLPD